MVMACVVSVGGISAHRSAWAWGDEGHRIVATIAYARLTPAAKTQVDAMLADDSDPLTAPDFASRATWADKWRDSDRGGDKARLHATQQWHFVNIGLDGGDVASACDKAPRLPKNTPAAQGPAKSCVVTKINQFAAELRHDQTDPAERLLALKFLLHLVGDLHQPLHASDHRDGGGNGQAVLYGKISRADNLHSYWDRQLVRKLGREPAAVAMALNAEISATQAQQWTTGSAAAWAQQSAALAKAVAYDFSGLQHIDDTPYLDARYEARSLPVVREQLAKAGLRLAKLLNTTLCGRRACEPADAAGTKS